MTNLIERLIERLNPGIRAKLSFSTAFFVIVIISLISFLYLQQQYDSLTKSFDREIKPLRLYTEKIVLDLENLSNSFLLIEDFRNRLKTKTQELKQYQRKTVQVEEKNWFTKNILGKLNLLKKDLINTKATRRVSIQDTYYSEYITSRKIQEIEDNIRNLMRDEKGNPIPLNKFKEIQPVAVKTNHLIMEIESINKDIDTNIEKLNKDLTAKEVLKNTSKESLNSQIQAFFYQSQKNNITNLGINTEFIRIQTFNLRENKMGFDTRIFTESSVINSDEFINNPLIQRDWEERTNEIDINELVDIDSYPEIGRAHV